MTFKTIFENNDFMIIYKHENIPVHMGKNISGLMEAIRQETGYEKLYLVHRLDKITSGLMIIAKNKSTAALINEKFQNHEMEKYYLALSLHKPKKKMGSLKGDLVKTRGGSFRLNRTSKSPSVTKFYSQKLTKDLFLFLVRPFTGKTHQVRVILKSIGSPILGDQRYEKKDSV